MNTCSLTITDVYNAEAGRIHALHKYVMGDAKLREEFYESIKEDMLNMAPKAIIAALDDFIKRKGFTILNEKAFVGLDEGKRYRVDVMYTIAV